MKIYQAFIFFFFACALLGGSRSETTSDILTELDRECIKELELDVNIVLENMDEVDFTMTEGNPKLNEFTECSYRKLNSINENNEIQYDDLKRQLAVYIEVINKDITEKDVVADAAVESCKTVEGTSLGDTLIKFSNCFTKYIRNV